MEALFLSLAGVLVLLLCGVAGDGTVLQRALGAGFKCLLFQTGSEINRTEVWCAGNNDKGQLGQGDAEPRGESVWVQVRLGGPVLQLAGGSAHCCALLAGGGVKCWGSNDKGQLGLGDTAHRGDHPRELGDYLAEVELGTRRRAEELVAGHEHTCARLDGGSVKCWGANDQDQVTGLVRKTWPSAPAFNSSGGAVPISPGLENLAFEVSTGGWVNLRSSFEHFTGSIKCSGANKTYWCGTSQTVCMHSQRDAPPEGAEFATVVSGQGVTRQKTGARFIAGKRYRLKAWVRGVNPSWAAGSVSTSSLSDVDVSQQPAIADTNLGGVTTTSTTAQWREFGSLVNLSDCGATPGQRDRLSATRERRATKTGPENSCELGSMTKNEATGWNNRVWDTQEFCWSCDHNAARWQVTPPNSYVSCGFLAVNASENWNKDGDHRMVGFLLEVAGASLRAGTWNRGFRESTIHGYANDGTSSLELRLTPTGADLLYSGQKIYEIKQELEGPTPAPPAPASPTPSPPPPPGPSLLRRILCLHSGGGSAANFERSGMADLAQALRSSNFDLVFAQAPEGGVWMRDAPSEYQPTTDTDWAATAVTSLNDVVRDKGPFYGILGYSQGSAFATYYLSVAPAGTFQVAMLFCGYLPQTHKGLLQSINARSPFSDVRALIFMGAKDEVITNAMTEQQATKFTSPVVIRSSTAGHNVPLRSDASFGPVLEFANEMSAGTAPRFCSLQVTGSPAQPTLCTARRADTVVYTFWPHDGPLATVQRIFSLINFPLTASRPQPVVINVQGYGGNSILSSQSLDGEAAGYYGFTYLQISSPFSDGASNFSLQFGNGGIVNDANPTPCSEKDSREITYLRAVSDFIAKQSGVLDSSKVFIRGFSQNAAFALYTSVCFADRVAGIWQSGTGMYKTAHTPLALAGQAQCALADFLAAGGQTSSCCRSSFCETCKYWPIYPQTCAASNASRKLVGCIVAYADDSTACGSDFYAYEALVREGNDARLLSFPVGGHKEPANDWAWVAGCLGLSSTCSGLCESSFASCMGGAVGSQQFQACEARLRRGSLANCEPGCSPSLAMLLHSERPRVTLSEGRFGTRSDLTKTWGPAPPPDCQFGPFGSAGSSSSSTSCELPAGTTVPDFSVFPSNSQCTETSTSIGPVGLMYSKLPADTLYWFGCATHFQNSGIVNLSYYGPVVDANISDNADNNTAGMALTSDQTPLAAASKSEGAATDAVVSLTTLATVALTADGVALASAELNVSAPPEMQTTSSAAAAPECSSSRESGCLRGGGAKCWTDGDYRMHISSSIMFQTKTADPMLDPWEYGQPGPGAKALTPIQTKEGLKAVVGTWSSEQSPKWSKLTLHRITGTPPAQYMFDGLSNGQPTASSIILQNSADSKQPWIIDASLFQDPVTSRLWMAWGGHEIWISELDPITGKVCCTPSCKNDLGTCATTEFSSHNAGVHTKILSFDDLSSAGSSGTGAAAFRGDGCSQRYMEGPALYMYQGNWFAFASWGSGSEDSTIRVCRSSDPRGPYVDKEGKSCLHFDSTTKLPGSGPATPKGTYGSAIVLGPEGEQSVPGHPYVWEEDSIHYLGYSFRKGAPTLQNGSEATEYMAIRRLHWIDDAKMGLWPTIWQPIDVIFEATGEHAGKQLGVALSSTGAAGTIAAFDLVSVALEESVDVGGAGGQGLKEAMVGDLSGEMGDALASVQLGGMAKSLEAGPWHTCAQVDGGHAECWGRGVSGAFDTAIPSRES